MSSPINIALVGLGFMASTHIKAYLQIPGARIAALCNPSGRHLDGDFSKVAGNVGSNEPLILEMTNVLATKCFEDLLKRDDIQVIDICAPTSAHRDLSVAALAAGKHVICEKPLARTVQQANDIVKAAARARTFFMPAMCMRFWPGWSWLKQAIQQQTYGKVLSAHFRRVAEPPAWGQKNFFNGAESGGALFDLHIHDTDFVQYCLGRPRRVSSAGYSKFSGAIDHVLTTYAYSDSRLITAEGSWTMTKGFGFSMSYTVNFERATADYDLSRMPNPLRLFEEGKETQLVPCGGPDGYVGELQYLLTCIREGKRPALVTAEDGLSSVEICAAEEKSVQTRQPAELDRGN